MVISVLVVAACIFIAAVLDGGKMMGSDIESSEKPDAGGEGLYVQTESGGLGTTEDDGESGHSSSGAAGAETVSEEVFPDDAWIYEEVRDIWDECRQLERGEEWKVPHVDEETFAVIQAAYAKIDFSAEFETGESEVYEEYRQKFWKLMQGEGTIVDWETGEELSIWKFMEKAFCADGEEYEPENHYYTYYLFDMDGDGCPELGIRENDRPTYFLRYDKDADRFYVWYQMSDYRPIGTGKGMYAFHLLTYDPEIWAYIRLNENADMECRTYLFQKYLDGQEDLFMVMLPVYADKGQEVEVTQEMKGQGVYVRSDGQWYFRITGEQFRELMDAYRKAYRKSNQDKFVVQYSYEELFGDFIQTASWEAGTVEDHGRMTQREAVDALLDYLYQDPEIVMEEDPPLYYFQFVRDARNARDNPQYSGSVICLACEGLSADGLYYLFGFYTQLYLDLAARYEEDFYSSSYYSAFAVNRETGEVIMEREQNEDTLVWEYSEEYRRIANMGQDDE